MLSRLQSVPSANPAGPDRLSQKLEPQSPPIVGGEKPITHVCTGRVPLLTPTSKRPMGPCSLGQVGTGNTPRLLYSPWRAQRHRSEVIFAYAPSCPVSALATSSFTPGPMVELTVIRLMYVPFTPLGFALLTASTRVRIFSARAFSSKLALPTPA